MTTLMERMEELERLAGHPSSDDASDEPITITDQILAMAERIGLVDPFMALDLDTALDEMPKR